GGLREHLRFFHTVSLAISRKLDIDGQAVKSDAPLKVVSIEPLKTMRLYDITTETGDFIATGVVSHNCFARPSHAYMELSPGVDFDTRLFYKASAANLLVTELASSSPQARLRTPAALSTAGVPSGVLVAPVIPALTDHEMEAILAAAAEAGVRWAGYVLLRLPYEIKDLFTEWLAEHYPERAAHVMSLIRAMRGGRANDANFGSRIRGTGPYTVLLRNRFRIACRRLNLNSAVRDPLDTALFCPPAPAGSQLPLGL